MIVNLCAYSEALTSAPECQFFTTYSLTSYLIADATAFTMTPSVTSLALKIV